MKILFFTIFISLSISSGAQILRKRTTTLMSTDWESNIGVQDSVAAAQHIYSGGNA